MKISSDALLRSAAIHGMINKIFGGALDIINQYGGDVINFAGDALIVRWCEQHMASMACKAAIRLIDADLGEGLSKCLASFIRWSHRVDCALSTRFTHCHRDRRERDAHFTCWKGLV